MNKHDRDNLKFLMTISPETFSDWLDQASKDDIDYALEIIKQHKTELIMYALSVSDLNVDDVSDAKKVIDRVKNLG